MHIHAALSSPLQSAYYVPRRAAPSHAVREVPVDRITLTAATQRLARSSSDPATSSEGDATDRGEAVQQTGALPELSESEQRVITELSQRDREVRTHEMAHMLAAGPYARGGPQYTYKIGPDGKRYAVGGAVPIDVSPVPGDPQATIQKAATVRRAALAPAHPSGADMAIAAKASAMMSQARQELLAPESATPTPGQESEAAPATPDEPDGPGTRAAPSSDHVCGPHCTDHAVQSGLTGQPSSATSLAEFAMTVWQSYQAPSRSSALFNAMA